MPSNASVARNNARIAYERAIRFHEEIIRGSALELAAESRRWKGEFVIGICNKKSRRSGEPADSED